MAARVSAALPSAPRYLLALSGGGDSLALLKALGRRPGLRCVHVNHHLGSQAAAMEEVARRMAARAGRALIVRHLGAAPSSNIEAWAREQRYAACADVLQSGEVLITAHHQQDQAETFLLAASRGSGLRGLRGMAPLQPFHRGWLSRPALEVPRQHLRELLDPATDVWVEDLANGDDRFDRSRLRQSVMPVLNAWKPEAITGLARSCQHMQGLTTDWLALLDAHSRTLGGPVAHSWCRDAWAALPSGVRAHLLRRWAEQAGAPPVPQGVVDQVGEQCRDRRGEGRTRVGWQGWSWRVHRQWLCLVPPLPMWPEAGVAIDVPARATSMAWPAGGMVCWSPVLSDDKPLRVRSVQPHEQFSRPKGSPISAQSVFAQHELPVWLRRYWPVLDGPAAHRSLVELGATAAGTAVSARWVGAPRWVQPWLERARSGSFR